MLSIKIMRNIIPLTNSVKVGIQSYFIHKHGGSFFMPASEEGPEYDEIMKINGNDIKEAQPIIDLVLKEIEDFEALHGNVETARKSYSAYQKKINRLKKTCALYQNANDQKKKQLFEYNLLFRHLIEQGRLTEEEVKRYIV